jgi:predicted dehydrogenase
MTSAKNTPIRWGILGPGLRRGRLASDLCLVEDVLAVSSRSVKRPESFADCFEVPKRHGSLRGLVSDPKVDVVYVSAPQSVQYTAAHPNQSAALESA